MYQMRPNKYQQAYFGDARLSTSGIYVSAAGGYASFGGLRSPSILVRSSTGGDQKKVSNIHRSLRMAPLMRSGRGRAGCHRAGRRRGPNGFDLASARCLQQPQAVASDLLGTLVTLPLEIELQARPLIGVHGLEVGSLELAIGRRLRHEQRSIGPADSHFRVTLDRCGGVVGVCLKFTLRRILGATGNRHGARYGGKSQKL